MRLVQLHIVDPDNPVPALEIRWTWLPFWLATNPKLQQDVGRLFQDAVLLNGVTPSDDDLDGLHRLVSRLIQRAFPAFDGLDQFLRGLEVIEPT